MPTPERRALLLLLALAVAGQGVRYLVTKPGEPAGGVQLLGTLGAESSLAQRDSAMRLGRPLAQDEHVNVDLAPAGELARLPRVGPRLAKTIGPHVVFSGACRGQACPARGSAPPEPSGAARVATTNLNTASLAELDALPGIGPARARAILRYREEHGEFATVEGLAGVPGLSRAVLARLKERVVVR